MTSTFNPRATECDALIRGWLDADLDEWTRVVIRRTFDQETGAPYWLRRTDELDFDPRDITRYEQLTAFGPFPLDTLRSMNPAELVPLAVPRPITGRVWDSGGTTGTPCRVYYTPDMLLHRGAWRRWSFVTEGFEPHRTWLQATPTGPHLIGNGAWEASELHAGLVYSIDMDPRWVKRLIREGRLAEANEYSIHLVDQIADVLQHGRIDYINTTPALLQVLARRYPDLVSALRGARLSGTQVGPDMYRDLVAALDGGICGRSYGNTFGNGAGLPAEQDGEILPYAPNYPQVTMAVVDRNDWSTTTPYGATGQVRLTVLHEDLFLPNVLERDQALRFDTGCDWPSDGVANVRPLQITTTAPEGLY
ncbi:hypothetical protein [Nocardia sp. CNY236]|uniref:hypothetical protein n=1 Tax=Nocardia sp. CNY236 TaxID=1169152 RepID=UPI0003F7FCD2|nr:hypothetical protein [Nocardia sp. CNY236]